MFLADTIVAISTPPGRGGIGVVRLSGREARSIAGSIIRFAHSPAWTSWTSQFGHLIDAEGEAVDQVVVTFFASPRSYTTEDLVEISCHGSPVVLRHCVEQTLQAGARLAEPGEFTLRAYLNGRLDLPQAEAVRDLIESTTLYQARIATQQVEGSVSRLLRPVKEQLIELISLLEAGIDFADNDVDIAPDSEIHRRLRPVRSAVEQLLRSFHFGKFVHSGFSLAIVGRPNVGKSSLFNKLLEQDRAIVTDTPGTTRDTVSETASIGGIPVRFIDTAGIRGSEDAVESLGIERSYRAMADADVTLVVLDASQELEDVDRDLLARGNPIVAGNKADKPVVATLPESAIAVSALTGAGIEQLRTRIIESVSPGGAVEREAGFITSIRHEQLLRESLESLDQAGSAVDSRIPHEMVLIDLYSALRPLDSITGATTADDILNRIFSTFCIGK